MPELEDVFDFQGFYKRLAACKIESKRICDMDKKEVVSLLNAAFCFEPKKCIYCKRYIPDVAAKNGSGVCEIDGRAIADCLAFCSYPHDDVPF